jgi:hypothetical protein
MPYFTLHFTFALFLQLVGPLIYLNIPGVNTYELLFEAYKLLFPRFTANYSKPIRNLKPLPECSCRKNRRGCSGPSTIHPPTYKLGKYQYFILYLLGIVESPSGEGFLRYCLRMFGLSTQ